MRHVIEQSDYVDDCFHQIRLFMRHVIEQSDFVDDCFHQVMKLLIEILKNSGFQPTPFARSEFLLYNVSNDYTKNGSIVDQKTQYIEDSIEDDSDGSWVTITFVSRSTSPVTAPPPSPVLPANPEPIEAVLELPAPEPEVVLPPPTHPLYITEKSVIIE
ncbi:unnamed protein product [Strongylus vulgaris]|uniref:Uncharacterized protein n=1 Tax=Strongylus vulgaris TaxID=40348 RepID=A0A3P7JCI8_STRVU|nr:unnamed protein product [Strongylus vulgaris]